MAVLRISKKQQNFVILDKTCLSEPKLSWGAKGLHAYLMSMPDNWRVQVVNLQKCSRNGRDAVRGFLRELEEAGYIKKSLTRQEQTGQFGGLEYLVLEVPDSKDTRQVPESENQSAELHLEKSPQVETPDPGNPETGIPSPEKTTLISNKYNNKLINKTAADDLELKPNVEQASSAAAVKNFNFKSKVVDINYFQTNSIQTSSAINARIGQKLTDLQVNTIEKMIEKLTVHHVIAEPTRLLKEITYVLLDPAQFKTCGKDFNYKLNAIRLVIQRGDWRTPIGMIEDEEKPRENMLSDYSAKLSQAHADLRHFQGLHTIAQGALKQNYEEIIATTLLDIKKLEQERADVLMAM